MKARLLAGLLLAGCARTVGPVQGPVFEPLPPEPRSFYLCEAGDWGHWLIDHGEVFLTVTSQNGAILERCAIPGGRMIVVGGQEKVI